MKISVLPIYQELHAPACMHAWAILDFMPCMVAQHGYQTKILELNTAFLCYTKYVYFLGSIYACAERT